ncbi:MAG: MtrB/PioB family outer membrane beta-barrel protein, partial [Gemmatimonadaceae bacterium]
MTRATKISAFVAMGLLMAANTVSAQTAPTITSGGEITIRTLGTEDVESSKFNEYRELPKGITMPYVNLYSNGGKVDFNLIGNNVQQTNQRYFGWAKAFGFGVKFDYNQIPHSMGNGGRSIFNESAPGVWTMPDNLQAALQAAVVATSSSGRTYSFYESLLASTFASANRMDVSGIRKTGSVELNVGKHLPLDVTLSYRNELKEGYRGLSGGNVRGAVNPSYEVASPLDEISHDFGIRAAKNFTKGNVYVSYNLNLYDNRAETLMLDNPFQAYDAPVLSGVGGPSRDRFVLAPDNEASTARAGFLLKFQKQTRISGSVALGTWTQDAPFYPYTANTAINTSAGQNAASRSALPQASYGGKVNTTMYNLSFSSRPIEGLSLRAQYRVYDLTDNSNKWIITGDMSTPHQNWKTITPTADNPYGHANANVFDTKSARYSASATYDFMALTVEGQVRGGSLERTYREAEKGTESGMGLTAIYHVNDWLGLRGTYDVSKRTAEGHTLYGFQMDEAAFENTRTGIDVELTPMDGLDLSVAYFRRNVEFTDRPNRCYQVSGACATSAAVATPIPNTPNGLLDSKYDTYTGQIDWSPNERLELGAFMTYEKDARTNAWTTNPSSVTYNRLVYLGTDETNTYGGNLVFHVLPEKATVSLAATHQKTDGLMDITAREAGSFYTPGRAGLIPAGQGGAADIAEWDDTELTSVNANFAWTMTKSWGVSLGYMFEKYDFKDAMNSNSKLMPAHVYIFMKPN